MLASEGYLNVNRDSLELRFQVRASTFYQRCRDQQYYINQLLKSQWHNETEIKQLKDRLKREVSKNKHHSNSGSGNNGASITEINPVSSASTSTITVGENCQLISLNLASASSSNASTSTSYSSSSASENTDFPVYSGTKSKNSQPNESKCNSKRSGHHHSSSRSSAKANSRDKTNLRYDEFNENQEACAQNIHLNTTNSMVDNHAKTQNNGMWLAFSIAQK